MTRGKITNKQTGLEITGELIDTDDVWMDFIIEGTTPTVELVESEWDFTPEPEPIKDGVYAPRNATYIERSEILKYRGGQWRDAHGYELNNRNIDVSRLVRLVPED